MRQKVCIGDLGIVVTGKTPLKSNKAFYGDYALFLKPTDISESNKFTYETEEMFSQLAAEKFASSLIPKGAICIPCIGTIGTKMTMSHCDCYTNQSINSIICNNNYNNEYVYYLMKNFLPNLKSYNLGTASGREFISKSNFEKIEIIVEQDPTTQKRIANILSRYDSLIENYQKQIKLLEESAQRLYKEWFIDLRFPGHENTKIVDGVPEGWEKKKVGDLISKVQRTRQVAANNYQITGKFPVIDQSRNYIAGYTDDCECVLNVTIPYIVFGDHTRVLKYVPFSFAKGADGTQLIMSNDLERMPQSLFYNSLIEIDLSNYSYARHFKYLKEESILVPSKDIAERYDKIVSKYFQSIQKNREQIRLLTEARDRLLPKLMSGEFNICIND
ncbi:MAG: restriction endonuclease subunit S [Bacteroidales bacterium]|nr:restriction endonuclease subunit S [Bacteroidales bacterium]